MARRSMKAKIQPSVQTFRFVWQPETATETNFIDLSQVASIMNRRFYRQGLNWAVAGFKLTSTQIDPAGNSSIHIGKLPNTWIMSNAWTKAFKAWQHMIKNATDEGSAESIKGKFLDFKIYANEEHHTKGFDRNLMPFSYRPTAATNAIQAVPGEWQPSLVELNAGPGFPAQSFEYELIAVGPNTPGTGASGLNAKSIINGYAASRALPYTEDPNTPDDADSTSENWIISMFNDGTTQDEEVIAMLQNHGDQAPYPFEGGEVNGVTFTDTMYPGGANQLYDLETHTMHKITDTAISGTTMLKGGNFPCGLIAVQSFNLSLVELEVQLVPGSHRGYLAESMLEM